MSDFTKGQLTDATVIGALIAGRLAGLNLLLDAAGADVLGLVTENPDTHSMLGRLKTIADGIAEISPGEGGDASAANQETEIARLTSILAAVDGLEALIGATNTALAGTLAVSATALPLPSGAATDAKVEAVRALLAGTLAISAASLPLPTGAATSALQGTGNTSLASIATALAGTLAISAAALPLPAGAATSAKQDAQTAAINATASANDVFAITPNDGADLGTVPTALLITGAGTLAVKGSSGTTVSLGSVAVGQIIPLRARRIMATGTTATVVGLV